MGINAAGLVREDSPSVERKRQGALPYLQLLCGWLGAVVPGVGAWCVQSLQGWALRQHCAVPV